MSWLDHQTESQGESKQISTGNLPEIEIMLPNSNSWITVNKNQAKRIYHDDLGGALLIIIDEVAELLTPSGVKTEEGKEEDMLRSECEYIIQSITQLGRSAGIHMVLATQRNDAKIINGTIQNNCQMRMGCGRLQTIASMMAFGNTIGTTINGQQPGAGAVFANGKIDMIQYYYADHSWIEQWYAERGLDKKGYDPNKTSESFDIENLDGVEKLQDYRETVDIEFAGVKGKVDKSEDQRFEEI